MQIQIEKLYLFETDIVDPFFLGTKDGVSTQFLSYKTISFLDIETAYLYMENTAKAGLTYKARYGGEDTGIDVALGKATFDYELNFNFPTVRQDLIERLVGREYSILCMKRDFTFFVIFGRFVCETVSIDNEIQQRLKFESKNTQARMINVNSFNITQIENIVNETGVVGFDYTFDFGLN